MAWRYLESLWLGENFMEHGKEYETKDRQKMRWEENVKEWTGFVNVDSVLLHLDDRVQGLNKGAITAAKSDSDE